MSNWSSWLQLIVIIAFLLGPPLLRVLVEQAEKARQRRVLQQQRRKEEFDALRPGSQLSDRPPTVTQIGGTTRGTTPGPANPWAQPPTSTSPLEPDRFGRAARRQAELDEWRQRRRQAGPAPGPTMAGPFAPPTSSGRGGGPGGGGGWSVPGDAATARAETERRRREAIEQLRRQTDAQRVEELRRRAMSEERERAAREAALNRARSAAVAGLGAGGLSQRQIEDLLRQYAAMTGRRLQLAPPAGAAPAAGTAADRGAFPGGLAALLGRPLEPDDLRTAIILKEVLDTPLALRNTPPGVGF